MEEFTYYHDFRGFVKDYYIDNNSMPKKDLRFTCKLRGEGFGCPFLAYNSHINGNHVDLPVNARICSQILKSGALDVEFEPRVDDPSQMFEDNTVAFLLRKGIDPQNFYVSMRDSNRFFNDKYATYTLPVEYYEAATVLRFSGGICPVNLPRIFEPTQHYLPQTFPEYNEQDRFEHVIYVKYASELGLSTIPDPGWYKCQMW